jgi:hypothetical protein
VGPGDMIQLAPNQTMRVRVEQTRNASTLAEASKGIPNMFRMSGLRWGCLMGVIRNMLLSEWRVL